MLVLVDSVVVPGTVSQSTAGCDYDYMVFLFACFNIFFPLFSLFFPHPLLSLIYIIIQLGPAYAIRSVSKASDLRRVRP